MTVLADPIIRLRAVPVRHPTVRVPIEVAQELVTEGLARCHGSIQELERRVGLSERLLRAITNGEKQTIAFETVDQLVIRLKGPDAWHSDEALRELADELLGEVKEALA